MAELLIIENELTSAEVRDKLLSFEQQLRQVKGALEGDDIGELEHKFGDGLYIRQITMPKGMLLTSKIHKTNHPYFVMRGDVSVLTDEGVVRIKAPYSGMTKAGTKRLLYIHEETVWTTVHATEETDLDKIEEQVIAKTFADVPELADR